MPYRSVTVPDPPFDPANQEDARKRIIAEIVRRQGQRAFRKKLLDSYEGKCAVTECALGWVLEAAHIRPYASGGEHAVTNGLSLRSDLHRLFDSGYVAIDEDHRFVVGRRLKDDFENGRTYYALHGGRLALPDIEALRPSSVALAYHREHTFLG